MCPCLKAMAAQSSPGDRSLGTGFTIGFTLSKTCCKSTRWMQDSMLQCFNVPLPSFAILFLVDCPGFERLELVASANHAELTSVCVLRLLQWAQRHGAEVSNALKVLEPQATGDRTCHSQERLEEGTQRQDYQKIFRMKWREYKRSVKESFKNMH